MSLACQGNGVLFIVDLQAPSLLITLINMFLDFTRLPSDYVVEGRDADENEYSVFGPSVQFATLQAIIQKGLVIVAVACVPVMLFVKPLYLKFQHKKAANVSFSCCLQVNCYGCVCYSQMKRPDRHMFQSKWGEREERWCMLELRMGKWGRSRRVLVKESTLSLGRCSSTRLSTPLSTVWERSPTQPPTSDCGLCLLLMLV